MKKIISFLITLSLLLSLMYVPAYAEDTQPGGFLDDHNVSGLNGWTQVGSRYWKEENGKLTPCVPDTQIKQSNVNQGFLISDYPCADNGTFEADLSLDQWNGNYGGVVLRWSSPNSYYFISIKPGNQWCNSIKFCKDTMDDSKGVVVAENFAMNSAFHLKVEVQGSTFKIYIDGVLKGTVTDSSHPYGRTGFGYSNQWNSYFSVDSSQWTDASGSTSFVAIDPNAGRVDLKVHIMDEAAGQYNLAKPRIYVENAGESTVDNFDCYYFFTTENDKTPVLEDYYTPESDVYLMDLGNNTYCVQYRFTGMQLAPGEITPNTNGNVVGIHYSDWSEMDKTNDFSNPGSSTLQVTDKVPVYGNFPAAQNYLAASVSTAGVSTTSAYRMVSGENPQKTCIFKKMTITRIHCSDTEDDAPDGDETYLDIFLDNPHVSATLGDHSMNDGDNWYPDSSESKDFMFKSYANIRVMDEDSGFLGLDDDDDLGTISVDTTDGEHSGRVTGDDADYTVYYTIESIQVPEDITDVSDLILENFKNSSKAGVWDQISKNSLINDMKEKLQLHNVNQGNLPYCGPAAIVYYLVSTNPFRYTVMCRDLYEQGYFHARTGNWNTSASLRKCKVPFNQGVTDADWMLMGTLMDHFSEVQCGSDGYPSNYEGCNWDDFYMNDFITQVLCGNNVHFHSSFIFGENGILEGCSDAVKDNGYAVMLIDSDLIKGNYHSTSFFDDDHWIALVGDYEYDSGTWYVWDSGRYKFRYYSYGTDSTVLDVDEATLEDFFYGAVYTGESILW